MILFDQVIHPSSLSLFSSYHCCSAILSDLRPTSPTSISLFFTLYSSELLCCHIFHPFHPLLPIFITYPGCFSPP